jgi:hypothetical protein
LWPHEAKKLVELLIMEESLIGIGIPETKNPEQKVL